MDETERKATVKMFLDAFKVNSIDDLPEHAWPDLIDMLFPDDHIRAYIIYRECNKKEKQSFVADIKKCINGNKKMFTYPVLNEGVYDDNTKDYFDFCARHSIWYEII